MRTCPLFLAAVCAFMIVAPASRSAPSLGAVEFTLTDQNARVHVIKYPREKISILVLSDHKGSSQIAGWISPIQARYEQSIDIAGLANLPSIPPMFQALFRREFKKRLAYPVMLDWSGDVARSFQYKKSQAQVFVIGTDGGVVLTKAGAANPGALADIYAAVDRLQPAG